MKMRLAYTLPLLAAILFCSGCAKEEWTFDSSREMEAEWAAACYRGVDEGSTLACYELEMTRGRIGEDLELLSSGFVAHLLIAVPCPEGLSLPDGDYEGADWLLPTYGLSGEKLQRPLRSGSPYIDLRRNSREQVQRYPLDEGALEVERAEDGSYRLCAELKSQGRTFVFSYTGELPTYDYTEPE